MYAMATRQAADAKAGATVARAETQAAAHDGKLRERRRMFVDGVARTEGRLTQLAEGSFTSWPADSRSSSRHAIERRATTDRL